MVMYLLSIIHNIYNIYYIYPHLDMTMFTSRITMLSRNHSTQNICTCSIVRQLDSNAADS